MPDWTAFGAVAVFVLFLVLGLAWITSGAFAGRPKRDESLSESGDVDPGSGPEEDEERSPSAERTFDPESASDSESALDPESASDRESAFSTKSPSEPASASQRASAYERESAFDEESSFDGESTSGIQTVASAEGTPDVRSIPTGALLANVLFTHGGMGLLLIGAAAMTGIPAAALGVEGTPWSTGLLAVGGGLAAGVGLAVANVGLAASLDRIGIDHNEDLRTALAPDSPAGWAVLLVVVLPLVAGFEELLFRAILIGGAATATGLSPWLFVLLSTVAFALGHGLQGKGGIAVTGLLGGALGVAFVLTNSLLLVVIAHYVVNAVEFLLKEWLAVDFDGRI